MPRSSLDALPKIGHVRELHNHINGSYWAPQRTLDKEFNDRYYNEHDVTVDDTAHKSRRRKMTPERFDLSEAARIVDQLKSFFPHPPRMQTRSLLANVSAIARENSGIALNEAFDQLNTIMDSPWDIGVENRILLGRSADLILSGNSYWSDFPWIHDDETEEDWQDRHAEWRKRSPLPITWQALAPESTFPASFSTLNDEVLSIRKVSWNDLEAMFDKKELSNIGDFPDDDSDEWFLQQTLGIYSNRAFIGYYFLAQGKSGTFRFQGRGFGGSFKDAELRTIEHGQNRCAIRILPGITGKDRTPGKYWRSVLFPIRGILDQIDKLASRASTAAKYDAYPLMQEHINRSRTGGSEGARAEIEQIQDGDVIPYEAGDSSIGMGREGMSPVFQPKFGDQTRELLLFALERAGLLTGASESLEGKITPNTPAWSENWSSEQSKRRLSNLTSSFIGAAIDIAEAMSRSVVHFDEEIPLARPEGKGTITLKPKDLVKVEPEIAGIYEPQLPINWLSMSSQMMDMLERAVPLGFPSPVWIAEKFGLIPDYWRHHQEAFEIAALTDPKIRDMQLQVLRDRFEVSMATDEGMTQAEFEEIAHRLPQDVAALMRQKFGAGPGTEIPPGGGGVSQQTAGLQRAGSPLSVVGTGPQPQEQTVG